MTLELREVEVEGRPARYRVTGSGEPLVLVHGLAGSWRWWSPMLQELGGRRRVHVVDLPRLRHPVRAEELSNWLGRWLDAVGLDQLELAGHSLGGLVAAEVAATRPEQTRRLILVAPAGIPCGRGLSGRALPLLRTLYDVRRSLPMLTLDAVRTGPLDVVKSSTGNSQENFWPAPFVAFLEHMFGFVPHSNSYAPIGTWSTMSIRDANLNFALQACGEAQGTGSGQP